MPKYPNNQTYLLLMCLCMLMPTCLSFFFKKDWIGPLKYSKMILCAEKYIIYSNETNGSTNICVNNNCISIPAFEYQYSLFACSKYYDDQYNYVAIKINRSLVKIWTIYDQQLIPVSFQLNTSASNSSIRQISLQKNILAITYDVIKSTSYIDVYVLQQSNTYQSNGIIKSQKISTIALESSQCSGYLNDMLNMIVVCEGSIEDSLYVYYGGNYDKYLNTSFYACENYSYTIRRVQLVKPTPKQKQNNIESKIYILYQAGQVFCNYQIKIKNKIFPQDEEDVKELQLTNDTNNQNLYGWRYSCNGRKFYHPYTDSNYIDEKYNYSIYPDVFTTFLQPISNATCTPMHGSPWTSYNVVFYLHSYKFLDPTLRYIDIYEEYSLIPALIIIAFLLLIFFLRVSFKFTYKKIFQFLFVTFDRQYIADVILWLQSEQ